MRARNSARDRRAKLCKCGHVWLTHDQHAPRMALDQIVPQKPPFPRPAETDGTE